MNFEFLVKFVGATILVIFYLESIQAGWADWNVLDVGDNYNYFNYRNNKLFVDAMVRLDKKRRIETRRTLQEVTNARYKLMDKIVSEFEKTTYIDNKESISQKQYDKFLELISDFAKIDDEYEGLIDEFYSENIELTKKYRWWYEAKDVTSQTVKEKWQDLQEAKEQNKIGLELYSAEADFVKTLTRYFMSNNTGTSTDN